MNKSFLIGRTTKEIELRSTKSGKSVCQFTLAVDRRRDETDFIPCVAWEKTAELIEQYVGKGDQIAIIGHLQSRQYEDQKKGKMTVIELIVDEVKFLTKKKTEEPDDGDDDYPF